MADHATGSWARMVVPVPNSGTVETIGQVAIRRTWTHRYG